MSVSSIRNSLKTRIEAAIGFTETKYSLNSEKNAEKALNQRYSVIAGTQSEVSGVVRHATIEQEFTVHLFDRYSTTTNGDSGVIDKIHVLNGHADTLYADVYSTRVGGNASVLNVKDRAIGEPEVNTESKTIQLSISFTVVYRFVV